MKRFPPTPPQSNLLVRRRIADRSGWHVDLRRPWRLHRYHRRGADPHRADDAAHHPADAGGLAPHSVRADRAVRDRRLFAHRRPLSAGLVKISGRDSRCTRTMRAPCSWRILRGLVEASSCTRPEKRSQETWARLSSCRPPRRQHSASQRARKDNSLARAKAAGRGRAFKLRENLTLQVLLKLTQKAS